MRILVLSDIHANITALDSVLASAGDTDATWCLGDVVGYGPDPNECISRLQELPDLVCLQGNHDAAAIGDLPLEGFNSEARSSIEWQQKTLTPKSAKFLKTLKPTITLNEVTLAHASPRQPMLEYLLDTYSAAENFEFFDTDFCFVGHTHVPVIFFTSDSGVSLKVPEPNTVQDLPRRCIANPGSVGQPRDRDPRCAYAIFNDLAGTWDYRRVDYDIASVQERMRQAELPERHIDRLSSGW